MKTILTNLPRTENADYLLDTCFLIYVFKQNLVKKLEEFSGKETVALGEFNALELIHVHHKLSGSLNHHMRIFFKKKLVSIIPQPVSPGNHDDEVEYVNQFDHRISTLIVDPSDAVLFTLALKIRATILTRDKHHIFTTAAETFAQERFISILNDFPISKDILT